MSKFKNISMGDNLFCASEQKSKQLCNNCSRNISLSDVNREMILQVKNFVILKKIDLISKDIRYVCSGFKGF